MLEDRVVSVIARKALSSPGQTRVTSGDVITCVAAWSGRRLEVGSSPAPRRRPARGDLVSNNVSVTVNGQWSYIPEYNMMPSAHMKHY